MLTHERLKEVLHYCPDTGVFTWRVDRPRGVAAGEVAGSVGHRGYRVLSVDGIRYRASRVAFLYMEGVWPQHQVDHRNRNTMDDRWSNLRHATPSENLRNRRPLTREGHAMSAHECKGVNEAYDRLLGAMKLRGVVSESRNGKVLTMPRPQILVLRNPRERVLFDRTRNANPYFHLMESIWMLAGRNDVAFVRQFNQRMYTFSDDGDVFNGAYGYRWRKHFGYDQISRACDMLTDNPQDRRVVITMWDPHVDLGSKSLDIPCNTQAVFRLDTGELQMVTSNRSNDLVWGLTGANAVHLTMLQEYMANRIGAPMGCWTHMSANLHIYEHHWHLLDAPRDAGWGWKVYPTPSKLVTNWQDFDQDCKDLCDGKLDYFKEPFFDETVAPMVQSWHHWKGGNYDEAMNLALCVVADDWRTAAIAWLDRAQEKRNAAKVS